MEIKLRAWDNVNKRMLYFSDLALQDEYDLLCFGKGTLDVPVGDNLEFMLTTGSKDKNGQECYGEDIFLMRGNRKYIIRWNESYNGWWLYWENGSAAFPFRKVIAESGEVVGNVYQSKAPSVEGKTQKEMEESYSIEQLKAMAREKGISTTGSKLDIIKRLI